MRKIETVKEVYYQVGDKRFDTYEEAKIEMIKQEVKHRTGKFLEDFLMQQEDVFFHPSDVREIFAENNLFERMVEIYNGVIEEDAEIEAESESDEDEEEEFDVLDAVLKFFEDERIRIGAEYNPYDESDADTAYNYIPAEYKEKLDDFLINRIGVNPRTYIGFDEHPIDLDIYNTWRENTKKKDNGDPMSLFDLYQNKHTGL